jgi:hypothetical protein
MNEHFQKFKLVPYNNTADNDQAGIRTETTTPLLPVPSPAPQTADQHLTSATATTHSTVVAKETIEAAESAGQKEQSASVVATEQKIKDFYSILQGKVPTDYDLCVIYEGTRNEPSTVGSSLNSLVHWFITDSFPGEERPPDALQFYRTYLYPLLLSQQTNKVYQHLFGKGKLEKFQKLSKFGGGGAAAANRLQSQQHVEKKKKNKKRDQPSSSPSPPPKKKKQKQKNHEFIKNWTSTF